MIDQRLDLFDEVNGMWQGGVVIEGGLVFPARVNVEQLRIVGGAKRVNIEATGFLARRQENIPQRVGHGILIAGTSMEPREDKEVHGAQVEIRK